MAEQGYSYVGIDPCGCVRAATADRENGAPAMRKQVNEMLKVGSVERWSDERVKAQFCFTKHPTQGEHKGCPHPGACPARNNEPKEG